MPSAVSSHSNYYTAHHRRQSSQSQTSSPDQTRPTPSQVQFPNRSLVFLPSTVYSPSHPIPTPSASTSRLDIVRNEDVSTDPHDFYRQYQDPFTNQSPVALHQEAIRTAPIEPIEERHATARKSSFTGDDRTARIARDGPGERKLSLNTQMLPNGTYASSNPKPHSLRSKKASFKDLVARFDASREDIPPLPTQQVSRPASRTASPMPYASGDTSHSYHQPVKRAPSRASEPQRRAGSAIGYRPTIDDRTPHPQGRSAASGLNQVASNPEAPPDAGRKLLFGEVAPSANDLPAAPGYGINARQRRGSEGSPMHSPNPMFRTKRGLTQAPAPPISPSATHPLNSALSHETNAQSRPIHRRANTGFSGPPSRATMQNNQNPTSTAGNSNLKYAAEANAKSRIPVSTRHQRISSDSAAISPTLHTTVVTHPQLPFRVLETGRKPSSPSPSGDRRRQSPRKQVRTPVQIRSPNNRARGATTANGEKSPSLGARGRDSRFPPPPRQRRVQRWQRSFIRWPSSRVTRGLSEDRNLQSLVTLI